MQYLDRLQLLLYLQQTSHFWHHVHLPSKNALARSYEKRSFFLHPCKILQDPAGSCKIMQDFAGILHESCTKFLQNPARSHRILQDLAGMQEKGPFLVRSCKNVFTGNWKAAFLIVKMANTHLWPVSIWKTNRQSRISVIETVLRGNINFRLLSHSSAPFSSDNARVMLCYPK